jgi:hypothetical protein
VLRRSKEGVDARDKRGHDGDERIASAQASHTQRHFEEAQRAAEAISIVTREIASLALAMTARRR